jgi:hypothetical protein
MTLVLAVGQWPRLARHAARGRGLTVMLGDDLILRSPPIARDALDD